MSSFWTRTSEEIRRHLDASAWTDHFASLRVKRATGGTLVLTTADEMSALLVEKNYRKLVARCAEAVSGRPWHVEIEVDDEGDDGQMSLFGLQPGVSRSTPTTPSTPATVTHAHVAPTPRRTAPVDVRRRAMDCGLSLTWDFGSFVMGDTNEFAASAARAVAEAPGGVYSPLFIYGGVGLGKTHLLNAIGLSVLERTPDARVRYVSAETFVNEFIDSLGSDRGRIDEFRERNRRDVDVLLLDDVQFLSGKERTQIEFFHTFNALHRSGRQIVLTSDRPPAELPHLEERLRSRLTSGLITDIQPPGLETRVAILQKRAEKLGFSVPRDVCTFIAENVRSNVRELHGALLRIGSWAHHRRIPITVDIAREQLGHVVQDQPNELSPRAVLKAVCEHFSVTEKDVLGRKRVATIATPRRVAMYLSRKLTSASYPELGQLFRRDHTTVLAACRRVEDEVEKGSPLAGRMDVIERRLVTR